MQQLQKQFNVTYFLAFIVVGAMVWQTYATRRIEPTQPAVLVTVDFVRVFESIEERAYEVSRVQGLVDAMRREQEERRLHIEAYDQELELYKEESPKWYELKQEQLLESLELQAQSVYFERRSEREETRGMRRLYEHIRTAAAELSQQNGWDYVFVNDAIVAMPEGDNVDMGVQISNRRMLYANSAMDVTDILIEYMNASFDEMAVR